MREIWSMNYVDVTEAMKRAGSVTARDERWLPAVI